MVGTRSWFPIPEFTTSSGREIPGYVWGTLVTMYFSPRPYQNHPESGLGELGLSETYELGLREDERVEMEVVVIGKNERTHL